MLAATKLLKEKGFAIFATQDWHPINHISFCTTYPGKKAFEVISRNGKEQVLWPPHCVQGSEGAKILIDEKLFDTIVRKGTEVEFESYSGFHDDGDNQTPSTTSRQRISSASLFAALPGTIVCGPVRWMR